LEGTEVSFVRKKNSKAGKLQEKCLQNGFFFTAEETGRSSPEDGGGGGREFGFRKRQ